jgi:adenylate cyclase
VRRKLTTILYADGVGFGGRMEADEDGTLERLRRARAVMRDAFEAHHGRVVNTWGDAVIAEFASVVEAVRCAAAIQDAIGEENAARPEAERLAFRIGVNLGDVMLDGDDLYGDGVNVAERLQALAAPGGVMVSGTVRELVHKRVAFAFDAAGPQRVKSLAEPVEAWRLRLDGANAPEAEAPPETAAEPAADPGAAPRLSRAERALAAAGGGAERWLVWMREQPIGVRRAAGMILLFLALNVLFGGLANPWFVFPSIPFALYVWRRRDPRTFPWQRPGAD